jgi:hypothetical protein
MITVFVEDNHHLMRYAIPHGIHTVSLHNHHTIPITKKPVALVFGCFVGA